MIVDISPPSLTLQQLQQCVQSTSYTVFPISRTINADLETPISAYLKLTQRYTTKNSFLLESVRNNEYYSRYSYIGCEPDKILLQNDVDPLSCIQEELAYANAMPVADLPEFTGGTVGQICILT